MASIRFWILLFINILMIVSVLVVSIFFYREFGIALNERVLLQLTSVRTLKQTQIEEHLTQRWDRFLKSDQQDSIGLSDTRRALTFNDVDSICLNQNGWIDNIKTGIYDLTPCANDGKMKFVFFKQLENDRLQFEILDGARIQMILLERSGIGSSGESYLVAEDFHLRSESRFFPKSKPDSIVAQTLGVERALSGNGGIDIFDDYRGIPVFSSYEKLKIPDLNWVILSEIDVAEARIPLQKMKTKLAIIASVVIILATVASMFITNVFSSPLLVMSKTVGKMAVGDFNFRSEEKHPVIEIEEIFSALQNLRESVSKAIHFSTEIGQMHLNVNYQLAGQNDTLGKSLIKMQERLIEYADIEKKNELQSKRFLIRGQENERKRISQELHDGLGPLLTSMKLTIESMEIPDSDKRKIKHIIDQTISDIRRITYDLMPAAIEDFGVKGALLNFVEMISKSTSVEIVFDDASMTDKGKLDIDLDICLFRICQELINNTLKHAEAQKIVFSITEFENKVSLYYRDDGTGFNITEVGEGSGIRNIRERIEAFHGFLNIESNQDGTEVEVELPLINEQHKSSHS